MQREHVSSCLSSILPFSSRSRRIPLCPHSPFFILICLYSHSLKPSVSFSDQGVSQASFKKEIEDLTEHDSSHSFPTSCQNGCWYSLGNSVIDITAPHHPKDKCYSELSVLGNPWVRSYFKMVEIWLHPTASSCGPKDSIILRPCWMWLRVTWSSVKGPCLWEGSWN